MNLITKSCIVVLLSTLISCSNEQAASDPQLTNQTDTAKSISAERFEISFPVTRFNVETVLSKDSAAGNVQIKNWILRGAENNNPFIYFVSQNEIPQRLKTEIEKDSNALYAAFQAGQTRSATPLGGKDFTFKKHYYKSHPGLESTCKVFDGAGIIKSRMYNINDTLYMISAGGRAISADSVDKFLNSFRIKN